MSESSVLAYLKSLPIDILETLQETPATAVAIYRFLPPISQQFVSRLILIEETVSTKLMQSWTLPNYASAAKNAMDILTDLRILTVFEEEVFMSRRFQKSLRKGIFGGTGTGGTGGFLAGAKEVDRKYWKSANELEEYSRERWRSLLQFLALPSDVAQYKSVSVEMKNVLYAADFIKSRDANQTDDEPEITSKGFQFLLMDRNSQIWCYLLHYLRYVDSNLGAELARDCLAFIFRLSFCGSEGPLATQGLDAFGDCIQHLRELGLIFMRKRKDGWFFSTPMVRYLKSSEGAPAEGAAEAGGGFVVVETNFRLYAYTDSVLQLAILSTFCDMIYRFSNLSVGILTRESVRKALQLGITAQQITDFLQAHSHSQMLSQRPILPPTVVDQLRLWELERDRLNCQESVLYSNFDSDADYRLLRDFAAEQNVLLWDSGDARLAIVSAEGHNMVKQFWKMQKKS